MGFCFYFPPIHCSFTERRPTKPATLLRHATMNRQLKGIARSTVDYQLHPSRDNNQLAANYQPSFWSPECVESISKISGNELQMNKERTAKLEEEVRCMLTDVDMEPLTLLEFIDDIQRLGLSYRCKKSLEGALDRISVMEEAAMGMDSMSATALYFRLLRQHGYKVSSDLFKRFKDDSGTFKACFAEDVDGMLSLYEASHLAVERDDILREAKTFTTLHLKKLNENTNDTRIAVQASRALEVPFHHGMGRLEARSYVDEYRKRPDANPVLLELAILDFTKVQSTLQSDLGHVSRWWNDVGLAKKLTFSRDRLVESFFFAVGIASEPQFTVVRKGLTKVAALITTIDDVYDVYGSLDELELFTDTVVRWDISAVDQLPDYMKLCFLALYNTVNEMSYYTLKEQGRVIIPHLTKVWADLCKAFLKEAKWNNNRCTTPTFEEYLDNAWISVSGVVFLVHAYFLAGHNITHKGLSCLENNYHDLLRCPSMLFRLYNDLSSSKAEIERGETINAISCYMHQTGASEEVARDYISKLIDKTWQKMNEQLEYDESNSPFGKSFVETSMNLARITRCIYQYGDDHSAPDVRSRNRVLSLIVEPIQ